MSKRSKAPVFTAVDRVILGSLQENARLSLQEISKMAGLSSKSAVHYRIKRLEEEGFIEGYHARVNPTKLGKDYITITFVRSKYGPGYHHRIGKKLAELRGVWGVYFVLGEIDFIVMARNDNRDTFMEMLEKMIAMGEIERTSTQVVVTTIKEDPRIEI